MIKNVHVIIFLNMDSTLQKNGKELDKINLHKQGAMTKSYLDFDHMMTAN